eukprot:CAMPEP_0170506624 /NCGR_PEP_ID=MMETSP0208-20121228/55624_1 /TAXON_ID=197538 /ORGANISM="Strombidium inclinatum, Strain S3" /LENGTH=107 /DNA_ID=CAMNT_0010788275 /DNA_START=1415 /DNA_END=1738 /DNA_ORIENTATION=+
MFGVGNQYEVAKYEGDFKHGKREGQGSMVWADGSSFEGTWKNDMRQVGKMVMGNGCVYEGKFRDDKFEDKNAKLFLPSMVIYEGEFRKGRTVPVAKLLYPLGDIYYG